MKTSMEMRLECIRLANTLATSKNIQPSDVVPTAMEYLKWIEQTDDRASESDFARLRGLKR